MRKTIIILMITLMCTQVAYAAEIPRESVSLATAEEQVLITENLIADVLDKVQNGMGYGEARVQANNILRNAVCKNETDSYGFGILSGISNNMQSFSIVICI